MKPYYLNWDTNPLKTFKMKKLFILLTTAAIPFLLVWIAFILTGFSFNPIEVFQNGPFWGISTIYWLIWVCMLGPIVETIYDIR